MPDWFSLALSGAAILLSLWSLWINQKTVRYWKERASRPVSVSMPIDVKKRPAAQGAHIDGSAAGEPFGLGPDQPGSLGSPGTDHSDGNGGGR